VSVDIYQLTHLGVVDGRPGGRDNQQTAFLTKFTANDGLNAKCSTIDLNLDVSTPS
jgi:hypothetical protein